MEPTSFSSDYPAARARFLKALERSGLRHEPVLQAGAAPDGSPLVTDIAMLDRSPGADRTGRRLLVTISGTHGVEGFCGSAIQTAWLNAGLAARDLAQVHVHALNAYGFAHLSRPTAENVDLNRHFVDFSRPLPPNPGYDAVHAIFCPESWNDSTVKAIGAGVEAHVAQNGFAAFRSALTAGQHSHPDGLFFGGTCPTEPHRIVADHLLPLCRGFDHVAIIDFHSGLGPSGFGERIVDHLPGSDGIRRCQDWFGDDWRSPHLGNSASTVLQGQLLDWIDARLPPGTVTALTLEFGTEPEETVIAALAADNWLRFHGDPQTDRGREIKTMLKAAFYTETDAWKHAVLTRGLETMRAVVAGLTRL